MKKVLVIFSIMSLLFLTACTFNENEKNNDMSGYYGEQQEESGNNEKEQEIVNIPTIEINGVVYKDINSIEEQDFIFNNNFVYVEPTNESGELYVKLSNDFIIEDSRKKTEKIEILPSKIFSTDVESRYIFDYKDEKYYIPVEKCEIGEERIVYRNYGIELLKEKNSIKVNDSVVNEDNGMSLYDTFLEYWRMAEGNSDNSNYARIYQVDFDNNTESIELIYSNRIDSHIHIDSNYATYSIISYSKENGAKLASNGIEMLWFNNILDYKNVFYGYAPIEINDVDSVICVNENVITGYYIYDKELGLIKVERFANGEKLDNSGMEKLSKIALTTDTDHIVKFTKNGDRYIDAFPMYDHPDYLYDENWEMIIDESTGEYKLDDNYETLKSNTKIYITDIGDDGCTLNFETENGEKYVLYYYYT